MHSIAYAGITLATSGDLSQPPNNLRMPGNQANDWHRGHKATHAIPLARGNRENQLTISVPWLCTSYREAHAFFIDHYEALPGSGTLVLTCGFPGDQSTREADAILVSVDREPKGLTVLFHYTFHCGQFVPGDY
jgi:hypothetical protein